MRAFIKNNLLLFIGAMLPVLLAAFFVLASIVPRWIVQPPQYDLLFFVGIPYLNDAIRTENTEGQIKIFIDPKAMKKMQASPQLMRYVAKSDQLVEVALNLPPLADIINLSEYEIKVPELQNMVLDPNPIAPDGYRVTFGNNNSSFLSTIIGGPYSRELIISKHGNTIVLYDSSSSARYRSAHFIGWVTSEGAH